jgi:AmmeMemoRadiSam system protein B
MLARKPAVAGQFYPDKKDACISEITECIQSRNVPKDLPQHILAAIVPHAGWLFSGDVAALVFNSIKQADTSVDTFVIFGAVHWPYGRSAAVYDDNSWLTPLGSIEINTALARQIVEGSSHAESNPEAHQTEHSIEVQVPFIQFLFPFAKIVPVMVPPAEFAVEFGRDVAQVIEAQGDKKIVCIGSTDLTHYGPRYGFDPAGVGADAIDWAKNVNDMEFINYALALNAEKILHTAMQNQNACGSGAAAATVSAAKALGKNKGMLLAHTHSNEVMEKKFGESSEESVGYAGIVF